MDVHERKRYRRALVRSAVRKIVPELVCEHLEALDAASREGFGSDEVICELQRIAAEFAVKFDVGYISTYRKHHGVWGVLREMPPGAFAEHMHLSRAVFDALLARYRAFASGLCSSTRGRPLATPLDVQLAAFLRHMALGADPASLTTPCSHFLATGLPYRTICLEFGLIGQSGACLLGRLKTDLERCLAFILTLASEYVQFPALGIEQGVLAYDIERRCGIPRIVGFVDSSHIPVEARGPHEKRGLTNYKKSVARLVARWF